MSSEEVVDASVVDIRQDAGKDECLVIKIRFKSNNVHFQRMTYKLSRISRKRKSWKKQKRDSRSLKNIRGNIQLKM